MDFWRQMESSFIRLKVLCTRETDEICWHFPVVVIIETRN